MHAHAQPSRSTSSSSSSSSSSPSSKCHASFFILGARKGGTTSMYHYLTSHPQLPSLVGMGGNRSIPAFGEVHFFGIDGQWARGLAWYNAQFPTPGPGQRTGESSVDTLVSGKAPSRLRATCGADVRLMVLLRDPVERLYSNYLMRIRMATLPHTTPFAKWANDHMDAFRRAAAEYPDLLTLDTPPDLFAPAVNMLYEGVYYLHLKRWFRTFPHSETHWRVYFSEDFFGHAAEIVKDAYVFLGADPGRVDVAHITRKSYNTREDSSAVPLRPMHEMSPEMRDDLRHFYAPFNRLLGALLRRQLPASWSQ